MCHIAFIASVQYCNPVLFCFTQLVAADKFVHASYWHLQHRFSRTFLVTTNPPFPDKRFQLRQATLKARINSVFMYVCNAKEANTIRTRPIKYICM